MKSPDEHYINGPYCDELEGVRDQDQVRPTSTRNLSGSLCLPLVSVVSEPTTSLNYEQTLFQASSSSSTPPPQRPLAPVLSRDLENISGDDNSMGALEANSNQNTAETDEENDNEALLESLSQSIHSNETGFRLSGKWKQPIVSTDIPTVFSTDEATNHDELSSWNKNFLILTSAGKPIYAMHGKDEQVISFMGIINTIMSYFQLKNSSDIRTISSSVSKLRFAFLNRSPIILVAYSSRGETTNELVNQLDFLHSYLLSSLSQRQVLKVFNKRDNFDLRNFLEATDFENLDEISSLISERLYPDVLLGALQCLTLKKSYRAQLHEAMLQHLLRESDLSRGTLLYGLIIAPNNKLCSVLRPRGHTLHTTDLHLLFCLIFHQFQNLDDQQELWAPICFPKFNSNGFLYCYIKFLPRPPSLRSQETKKGNKPVLVLISAQKDVFFKLKTLGGNLIKTMQESKLLDKIFQAKGIKISEIPAPLVHHFIYKSKKHVQYIMPELQLAYQTDDYDRLPNSERTLEYEKKLMTYYQQLHNSVVRDDGSTLSKSTLSFVNWEEAPSDLMTGSNTGGNIQNEKISMIGLAWITPKFELYLICNNGTEDRNLVSKSAKKIANWCRKHEESLFVNEGAIF